MSGAGKSGGKGGKMLTTSKSTSRSNKAGLTFPVGRTQRLMKEGHFAERIGTAAPVYVAAVLEYLCGELLDLTVTIAKSYKKSRVTPQHIQYAMKSDEEFSRLTSGVTIANGGVYNGMAQAGAGKKDEVGVDD